MGNRMADLQTHWRSEELALLDFVSRGYANKEIAFVAGVSITAVKKRLARLMQRLGVDSRTALVRAAFESGLLTATREEGETPGTDVQGK